MLFNKTLERLETACGDRGDMRREKLTTVYRSDIEELIYHFKRLDMEIRIITEERNKEIEMSEKSNDALEQFKKTPPTTQHRGLFTIIWHAYTPCQDSDTLIGKWIAAAHDTRTRFYSIAGGISGNYIEGEVFNLMSTTRITLLTHPTELARHKAEAFHRIITLIDNFSKEQQ